MLNARPGLVAREAAIIAQAGLPGRVTIATNVAGRGTDIILGGNPKGLATSALEDLALPFLALGAPAWLVSVGGLHWPAKWALETQALPFLPLGVPADRQHG